METLLTDFRLDRPTWFYLSLLLILSIYFRFGRFWSLRNLDLVLLLSLSPGLLMAEADRRLGFVWLFGASAAILVRLLVMPCAERFRNDATLPFIQFHGIGNLIESRLPAEGTL